MTNSEYRKFLRLQKIESLANEYCESHKSNMDGVYNYSILAVKEAFKAGMIKAFSRETKKFVKFKNF
jgi:hypothetical protein